MAGNKPSARNKQGFLNPSQQWLALTLLALLIVIAIFYFGVGFGNGAGNSG